MKWLAASSVLGLVALVACETSAPLAPTESAFEPLVPAYASLTAPDTLYQVHGHAVINEFSEFVVAAVLLRDGRVNGHVISPGGLAGPVVELVPSSDTDDFWCVNFTPINEFLPTGYRILVFLRDIGDGLSTFDEINFNDGIGIDCTAGVLPGRPWDILVSGDFKTMRNGAGRR